MARMARATTVLRFFAQGIAALLAGCTTLLGGVQVNTVSVTAEKPSNVAVYLAVSDSGEPIGDLTADNFKLFENEQVVPFLDSQLTLLDRNLVAVHQAVLLVDMSGSLDEAARHTAARAAAGFVQKVRRNQAVAVFAFDGGSDLVPAGDFERGSKDAGPAEIEQLANFTARDSSRNLNGAVLEGLKQLESRMMAVKKPARVGTLVVLSRGPDMAGRASDEAVEKQLDDSRTDVIAVGIGEAEAPWLDRLGRFGVVRAQTPSTIGVALDQAADKVALARNRYYLVSYCSPSRAGKRWVRIDVTFNKNGHERSGSVEHEFDATGFSAGCDAKAPPSFAVAQAEINQASPQATEPAKAPETPSEPEPEPKAKAKPRPRPPAKPANDTSVAPPEKPDFQP